MVWEMFVNGLSAIGCEGQFDILITTDQNLRYQQNLAGRRLAILILPTTSWPRIQGTPESNPRGDECVAAW
jgi:hypothetical protein